jgi:hypothetical protein
MGRCAEPAGARASSALRRAAISATPSKPARIRARRREERRCRSPRQVALPGDICGAELQSMRHVGDLIGPLHDLCSSSLFSQPHKRVCAGVRVITIGKPGCFVVLLSGIKDTSKIDDPDAHLPDTEHHDFKSILRFS